MKFFKIVNIKEINIHLALA